MKKDHDSEDDIEMFTAPEAKILLVDDNIINLKVAKGILKQYKAVVETATSGMAAIEMAEANEYDIIFMDHMMPEMDGVEATRRIRDAGNEVTIVALTANALKDVREMFLSNGFQDFVPKPIDQKQLRRVLDHWIPFEKKRYGDTDEAEKTDVDGKPKYKDKMASGLDMFEAHNINFVDGVTKSPLGMEGYLELLELFYEQGLETMPKIKNLAEKEDYVNYTIEVHGLKSASYNVSANQLGDMAKDHEFAGKDGNNSFIQDNLDELLDLYNKVLTEIKSILEINGIYKDKEAKELKEISPDEVILMTKDILGDVQNFKSKDAKEKLNSILNYAIPDIYREDFENVQKLLKMYEDEEAEEVLGRIIEQMEKG